MGRKKKEIKLKEPVRIREKKTLGRQHQPVS